MISPLCFLLHQSSVGEVALGAFRLQRSELALSALLISIHPCAFTVAMCELLYCRSADLSGLFLDRSVCRTGTDPTCLCCWVTLGAPPMFYTIPTCVITVPPGPRPCSVEVLLLCWAVRLVAIALRFALSLDAVNMVAKVCTYGLTHAHVFVCVCQCRCARACMCVLLLLVGALCVFVFVLSPSCCFRFE